MDTVKRTIKRNLLQIYSLFDILKTREMFNSLRHHRPNIRPPGAAVHDRLEQAASEHPRLPTAAVEGKISPASCYPWTPCDLSLNVIFGWFHTWHTKWNKARQVLLHWEGLLASYCKVNTLTQQTCFPSEFEMQIYFTLLPHEAFHQV